jgi:hypothetical protein
MKDRPCPPALGEAERDAGDLGEQISPACSRRSEREARRTRWPTSP